MSRHGVPGESPEPYRRSEEYGAPPSDPWGAPVPGPYQEPPYQGAPYQGPPYEGPPYQEPGYEGYQEYGEPPYRSYQQPYQEPYPEPYPPPAYDAAPPGHGPPPPEWDVPPAEPPPPPRRNLGLYVTVAVLVVLAAAGVGYALFLLSGEEGDGGTPIAADPTTDPTPAATGGQTTSPDPNGSPPDNIGMNAAMAQVDDCLVNDGTAEQPQMRIVPCDADEAARMFRILEIFDQRIEGEGEAANAEAQGVCAETEGYTHHYYEVSESASFVLCMTEEAGEDGADG